MQGCISALKVIRCVQTPNVSGQNDSIAFFHPPLLRVNVALPFTASLSRQFLSHCDDRACRCHMTDH